MLSDLKRRAGILEVTELVKFPAHWASPVLTSLCFGAVFATLAPQPASAQLFNWFGGSHGGYSAPSDVVPEEAPVKRRAVRSTQYDKDAGKFGKLNGPLAIVVSIAKQRVTLFADGKQVAEAPVSTGTTGHETPMGIFAIIAKSRFHESNIYSGAPMPYMERITWSGIALHEGPLPGHAASHGCIRLPGSFASSLFKVTKLGARVVVTRDPVAPVAFASPRLFTPKKLDEKPADMPVASAQPVVTPPVLTSPVLVADAQATSSIRTDEQKPEIKPVSDTHAGLGTPAVLVKLDEKPATVAPEVAKPADTKPEAKPEAKTEAKKRKGPVQVFVSRKTGRLYVRQDFQPLFDVPVTIADPTKPWGTHIFTAMEIKDDQVRWTAITLPSGFVSKAGTKHGGKKLSAKETERREKLVSDLANAPTAAVALERFEMPKDAVDRISELLKPGSSLIVSDNGLSEETGLETDFVVATQ
ncbi:MAG TPA: L,D-transpeptidase [Pseudolabrys sp.]